MPIGLGQLLASDAIDVIDANTCVVAAHHIQEANPDALIIDCQGRAAPGGGAALVELLGAAESEGISALVLSDGAVKDVPVLPAWAQVATRQASADEIRGRLESMCHTADLVKKAQREVRDINRLGRHINQKIEEQTQEMRLASSLQQKFLPRNFPDLPGLEFSVIYRPASWVSGDIYDISRVDEHHVCVYIADCVGHGVAASLLTIFVKQAMRSKRIERSDYHVLTPSHTLGDLNEALLQAELDALQFVTATYCLIDVRDWSLSFARAGHPYAMLFEPDGAMRELDAEGPLLGLIEGEVFETKRVPLTPGQKLVLYSDGVEEAFTRTRGGEYRGPRHKDIIRSCAHLPAEDMARAIERAMEAESGSLNPTDDMTLMVMEVTAER